MLLLSLKCFSTFPKLVKINAKEKKKIKDMYYPFFKKIIETM